MLSDGQHIFIFNSVFDTNHCAIIWILRRILFQLMIILLLHLFFIIGITLASIGLNLLLDFLYFDVCWALNFWILVVVVTFDWWWNVSLRSCFCYVNFRSWVRFLDLNLKIQLIVWSHWFPYNLITVLLCCQPGLLVMLILIIFSTNILFYPSNEGCTRALSILFTIGISIIWFIANWILHLLSHLRIRLVAAWILPLLIFSDPIVSYLFWWLSLLLVLFVCWWLDAETDVDVHFWWV